MNVLMAGMDYSLASIEVREKFSFTTPMTDALYEKLSLRQDILGAVLISTCNRTELYISCDDDVILNPFQILCETMDYDFDAYKGLYKMKSGDGVIRHLCELSCGIKSQIWGEDQIITQVKNSITSAREHGSADSVLEVLFRNAITCAKKIKTTLKLCDRENSIAYKALYLLQADPAIHRVLVVGNGEIGRLTASILVENGYHTTMTLRQYRYGANVIPEGTETVNYSDRYEILGISDAVVSATLSPHFTLEYDKVQTLSNPPKCFIDLAVPRDIDPNIKSLQGVRFYDVDSICAEEIEESHAKQLVAINQIIEKYITEYKNWCAYKKGMACI